MGDRVLRALMEVFGHQRGDRNTPGYYETKGDHNFRLGPRANIYVRKARSLPNGVQPYARFIPTALENFPNGSQLRAYIERNNIPYDGRDYRIHPEHIDAVIAILQGGQVES